MPTTFRLCLALLLPLALAGASPPAAGQEEGAALRAADLEPGGGVDIHYDLDAPHDPAGQLQGVVRGTRGEWRARVRVDPDSPVAGRLVRMDTQWQSQQPGLLSGLVLGDTLGSGGGWSRPVRFGGVRLGRGLQLRPGFDDGPHASLPGSAALPQLAMDADAEAALDGLPDPGAAPAAASLLTTAGPSYELEAGRLRSHWGTPEDRYGEAYAAGAWRAGLPGGAAGELRGEWTPGRRAAGLELAHAWDERLALRAVLARSETADEAGRRWGLAVVRSSDGLAWTLGWDGYERGYTPLAAGEEPDPRARLHAGAALTLRHDLSAALSYGRESAWGAEPVQVLGLAARYALPVPGTLTVTYSQRSDDAAQRRIGLTLDLALER